MSAHGPPRELLATAPGEEFSSGLSRRLTRRPAALRARNADPLESRISRVSIEMLIATDWETRAALWQEVLALLKCRPPELVAQLEAERLQRVMRGEP